MSIQPNSLIRFDLYLCYILVMVIVNGDGGVGDNLFFLALTQFSLDRSIISIQAIYRPALSYKYRMLHQQILRRQHYR